MQRLEPLSPTPLPLSAVVTTVELSRRPPRPRDFAAENWALDELAQTFGASHECVLQKLADIALDLCKAHSAGITLPDVRSGERVLRWTALAGKLAPRLGSNIVHGVSPCATALDRDAIQLMSRPARHFSYLHAWSLGIEEALIVPFHVQGKPHGTIWLVAHDDTRRFDAEDARLMIGLSRFAAAACEVQPTAMISKDKVEERGRAAEANISADTNKDRFLAILGHELRSGLAPVKTAAEMLKHKTLDAATIEWIARTIDRQVGGMTRLIDDLLDVARVRVGNLQLRRERCAVSKVISHAVETVSPLVAGRTLTVSVPTDPIFVDADVIWLSHALCNLLSNAAKYTDPSGLIAISAKREKAEVVIKVSDNGIGIAREELPMIFELYAQAGQKGTERSAGGLGIGLHLARLLIEAHGGTIRATSAGVGRGSEFIVGLPYWPVSYLAREISATDESVAF